MLKKLAIILLLPAMALAFAACGSGDQPESGAEPETEAQESTEMVSGGWEIVEAPEAASLPGEVQTAFDQFMENYNDELTPMAYYGKQITSGTNYGLVCKSKNDNDLQTVVLQEDPELGMSAVVNRFNIAGYTDSKGAELSGEAEDGAWEVPYDTAGSPIPEDAQAAYDTARQAYEGTAPEPLALLGTQVVAGTNYAFLAKGKTETDDPVTAIQVVVVYADLQGNAEISNVCTLDLGEFDE